MAKLAKVDYALRQIIDSKTIIITALLYYGNEDLELSKQSLLLLHCCFKFEDFGSICINKHKFVATIFDSFVR